MGPKHLTMFWGDLFIDLSTDEGGQRDFRFANMALGLNSYVQFPMEIDGTTNTEHFQVRKTVEPTPTLRV